MYATNGYASRVSNPNKIHPCGASQPVGQFITDPGSTKSTKTLLYAQTRKRKTKVPAEVVAHAFFISLPHVLCSCHVLEHLP